MKPSRSLLTVMFLASAVAISACSDKDRSGRNISITKGSSTETTTVKTATTKEFKDSYQFKTEECDTGKQEFKSTVSKEDLKEQLCEGLQDSERNNHCAPDSRKEHFAKKCPDMNWTPTEAPEVPATDEPQEQPKSLFQLRELEYGDFVLEVPVTSPQGAQPLQSELTHVSCLPSAETGVLSGLNGFALLGGSKAILIRDTNYEFGDGTTTSNAAPYAEVHCVGAPSDEEISSRYQKRRLSAGESVMDVPVTSPNADGDEFRSVLTFISCVEKAEDAVEIGKNGLILLGGSTAVIVRDTNYQFGDGSSSAGSKPVAVFICE